MATPPKGPPRWLTRFNVWLLRRGAKIGSQHVLTVVGRRTGRPRSTPVSLVTLEGVRYVVSTPGEADWTRNVRAAGGLAVLGRAGRDENVRLVSITGDHSQILREFVRQVRGGVRFLGLPRRPDAIDEVAQLCQVFRVEARTARASSDDDRHDSRR